MYLDMDGKEIKKGTYVYWKDGYEQTGIVMKFLKNGYVEIEDSENDLVDVHKSRIWQE